MFENWLYDLCELHIELNDYDYSNEFQWMAVTSFFAEQIDKITNKKF